MNPEVKKVVLTATGALVALFLYDWYKKSQLKA